MQRCIFGAAPTFSLAVSQREQTGLCCNITAKAFYLLHSNRVQAEEQRVLHFAKMK